MSGYERDWSYRETTKPSESTPKNASDRRRQQELVGISRLDFNFEI